MSWWKVCLLLWNKVDCKWLLNVRFMICLTLAAKVAANYISEAVKVVHIVIQDL